jgi:aspartokinase
MIKEELTKLLMEAYERGQSDLIKSCQETVSIAINTAILAEREACAKLCDEARAARLAEQIRARVQA